VQGIWPILYAYFTKSGELDRTAMRVQVQTALASGAPGVAVLGLATEVNKLTPSEKRTLVDWAAADLGSAGQLAVTISGPTADEQIELAQFALSAGAAYLIVQPPLRPAGPIATTELEVFFDLVMEAIGAADPEVPVGIQNAPEFLGVGLDPTALARLRSRRPNFRFLKGEAPAVVIERTIAALGPGFPVLNGRGGMELPDNLRAGCRGMIVALDCAAEQQAIARAFAAGDIATVERQYARILPAIAFAMQSLDTLVVYGKRIAAWRMGFEVVHDRRCALSPTPFGLAIARRYAEELGPLRAQGAV
jgi:4-hydroxy-tetrahydrodipicolinate synthase